MDVRIYEVGPRDGLQNEPETLPTGAKRALLERLVAAGLREVEATSFVSPKWIPQLADADDLTAALPDAPGVRFSALVPNERGYARFAAAPRLDVVALFVSASESHNRKNLNCGVDEQLERMRPVAERARADGKGVRAYVSTVCGCPYEGAVAPGAVVSLVERLLELGVGEVSLGDTIGVGVPRQLRALVEAVAGAAPLERIALHLHDTYGRALANVEAGFEAGVRCFDASLAGLGGCPYAPGASGNVATEDVVDLFERGGVATGVSLDALVDASAWLEREVLRRELPGRVYRAVRGARERARRRGAELVKREQEALEALERIRRGGDAKYHEKARADGKLFCRERLGLLLDAGSFVEEAAFANSLAGDLPADGVVTGAGSVAGRPVCVMANDSTVKAGSWGKRTVEKILRVQELAERRRVPLVYLVDSAGARITDQIQMFPGRRGAGRIFHNQVRMSGRVPQVCLLFGPSAAGGAYIPAFCDIVVMVEGNASMYLGSPRMTAKVIGQETTLEEMGGARMHCSVSGCGDVLVASEPEAIEQARAYLSYLPSHCDEAPPQAEPAAAAESCDDLESLIPAEENKTFDMRRVIERVIDAGSLFEIKKLFAKELITGFARIEGRPVGIVANQPRMKGGVLFVDSADKAARFIWLCDAFGLPIVFLADVPGFMVGVQVEREGIIRAGAKMIHAVSSATVPRFSVIVRKAYGAGLYAMSGPGFEPEATLALPGAMIAVMGPEAAVNAVYFNKLQAMPEAEREIEEKRLREEYRREIDVEHLASELAIDAIVAPRALREELAARLRAAWGRRDPQPDKRRSVTPV